MPHADVEPAGQNWYNHREYKGDRLVINMRIKMIALDLDGTLLDSKKHISPASRQALCRAMAAGIHIVIASGRPRSALPEEVLGIPGLQYAITSNGSSIFRIRDMERVYGNDLSASAVAQLLPFIGEGRFACECAIRGTGYTMQACFNDPTSFGLPASLRDYVRSTRQPVNDMYEFIAGHCREIEGIFFLIPDAALKESTYRRIRQIPDIYITSSNSYYLEIADRSVSKANALDSLAHALGVTAAEIAAFGDSGNDLELLQYAGVGVAMGNASPSLKAQAAYITSDNDEDGVAAFINDFILGRDS